MGLVETLGVAWRMLTQKPDDTVPRTPVPVHRLTTAALVEAPDRSLYRLGHSTVLLRSMAPTG